MKRQYQYVYLRSRSLPVLALAMAYARAIDRRKPVKAPSAPQRPTEASYQLRLEGIR